MLERENFQDFDMLPKNIVPITNKQAIKFKCTACGACCKNVKDSIILEPLDAFRIIAEKRRAVVPILRRIFF